MRKIKPFALAVAVFMLMSMLMSCSAGKSKSNVVKADEPWYETTRFELAQDLGQHDQIGGMDIICASNDKVFYIYCFSKDMGATYRNVLDTYDFDGNKVKRTDITCSEGSILTWYSISSDPEGKTITAVVEMNLDGKYGPAFADIDVETGKASNVRTLLDKNTEKVVKKDAYLGSISSVGDYNVAMYLTGFDGGLKEVYQPLLLKNKEFVAELDLSTVNIRWFYGGFSLNEKTNSLYTIGLEEDENVVLEFDTRDGKLKSKKSYKDLDDKEVNLAEYAATTDGSMCKYDSYGNISVIDVNTMKPKTLVDNTWYNPYYRQNIDTTYADHHISSGIISANEERTIIWTSESTEYGLEDYTLYDYITVIKKADKNPNVGKKIIEIALPSDTGVSEYLAKNIFEFNNTDSEYIIRIWSKYNTGKIFEINLGNQTEDEKKTYEMIQDLKGNEAPDLAVGIQSNHAMRDDIFMDLSDFLDPEVMDKQFKNIIEAGKLDGKLYFLPVTLEIEGLVTNEDLLKDGAAGITFDDFDKLIKDNMHGFSPYDYPLSSYNNKQSFILSCIDTKRAIEGKTIEFGTDQFRTAVEYAKANLTYDDEKSMTSDYILDFSRNRGECYYAKMNDYLDFVHACFRSKANYRIIGTPSVDASGPRFTALETISVSATTDVKEGCKKFLNYLFSGSACASYNCEFRGIVTNREIMLKNIDTLTEKNNEAYDKLVRAKASGAVAMTAGAEKAFGDKNATDSMRESFINSMSTISVYYYEDYKIKQFVLEELTPYYAGDRSLDDAIKFINDRVAKYVREM